MSLVQYSSSSEDESEAETELVKVEVKVTQKPTSSNSVDSIANFLPKPTNRAPPKKFKDTTSIPNLTEGVVNKRVSSFVPTSVKINNIVQREKQQKLVEEQKKEEIRKTLNVFASAPREKRRRQDTVDSIKVIHDYHNEASDGEEIMNNTTKHREEEEKEDEIREFNVDKFYQSNIELKEKGELKVNEKLHSLTDNKNQLSSLVKNAKLDSELLLERIDQRKKFKKDNKDKYGW